MTASANIAQHLPAMAERQPDVAALKIPRPRRGSAPLEYLMLSFAELDREVDACVAHLRARGVQPGDRVLIMVRQGLPLIAGVFALFKHGAVPIVIDPGMGLGSFLHCVRRSRPQALLGIPVARAMSYLFRKSFATVRQRVPASGSTLQRVAKPNDPIARTEPIARAPQDLAAILFTSGSTGAAKGVCYEHGMFAAQVETIRETYAIAPGEIDLPMLPIFALFNPALGMTTVVPEINPSRPATVDPARIVQAIQQERVTNSFGSPTLWTKIVRHCIQTGTTLPTLRRVLCAGAPVPAWLWENARQILPNGELHSPYGATEALPVSTLSASAWAQIQTSAEKRVAGACVGRPVRGSHPKIVAPCDGPITAEHLRELPAGEVGEIIVAGAFVTRAYDALPHETEKAKIVTQTTARPAPALETDTPSRPAESYWHRMGDCGYFDAEGRLWFCGRKVERVQTAAGVLYPEPCEAVFRDEAGVARCALVGLGSAPHQAPAIVVQPNDPRISPADTRALAARLRERARAHAHTREITRFFFHREFPVDVRHNAKIHRLALAKWAATQTALVVE